MEYNEEILLLWKLYKELRPKIKENILTTGEYIKKEFYDAQMKYYENKIEEIQNNIEYLKEDLSYRIKFSELYNESTNLFQFILKIIPLKYRTKIFEKFKGKLQYFKFKEEI